MNLDYLEIGACDFNLLCRNKKKKGITIEPVEYYYQRIKTEDKMKIAISNKNGSCLIHYLPISIIEDYNMPNWLRGCNSINNPHPTTLKQLEKYNLPIDVIQKDRVRMLTLNQLIVEKNIQYIDYLKLDCEGHDILILKEFFKEPKLYPNQIYFESNILSDRVEILEFIKTIPYSIVKCSNNNILLEYDREY